MKFSVSILVLSTVSLISLLWLWLFSEVSAGTTGAWIQMLAAIPFLEIGRTRIAEFLKSLGLGKATRFFQVTRSSGMTPKEALRYNTVELVLFLLIISSFIGGGLMQLYGG